MERVPIADIKGNITSEEQLPMTIKNYFDYLRSKFPCVKVIFEYDEAAEKTEILCENVSRFECEVCRGEYEEKKQEKMDNIVDYLIKESKNYKETMLGDVMYSKTSNNEMDNLEETVSTIIDSLPMSEQKIIKDKLESYIKKQVVTSMEYVFLDSIIRTIKERVEPKAQAVTK